MSRILLIESEAPLVRLMSWFLIEAGYEVSSTDGFDTAIDCVRRTTPAVIIVNTGVPDEERAEHISSWRSASPGSRILDVISADALPSPRDSKVGADASIKLPFYSDRFIGLVGELAGRDRPRGRL